jgi:hypothetical protein
MNNTFNYKESVAKVNVSTNGVISTAQLTVDIASTIEVTATVDNLVLQLATPTESTFSHLVKVIPSTTSKSFTIYDKNLKAGQFSINAFNSGSWSTLNNQAPIGNCIAFGLRYADKQKFQFDNLIINWNATTSMIEIATVTGTAKLEFAVGYDWGIEAGGGYSGGGGIQATYTATPLNLTTTAQNLGINFMNPVEIRKYHFWLDNGTYYVVNITKKGADYLKGHVTYEVFRPGVNIPLNLNVVSKKFATASGIAQSEITIDELVVRYNSNAIGGNLDIKSSNSTTPTIIVHSSERYPTTPFAGYAYNVATLNAISGAFQTIGTLGVGVNEIVTYDITTPTANVYKITFANYGTTNMSITAEKLTI